MAVFKTIPVLRRIDVFCLTKSLNGIFSTFTYTISRDKMSSEMVLSDGVYADGGLPLPARLPTLEKVPMRILRRWYGFIVVAIAILARYYRPSR